MIVEPTVQQSAESELVEILLNPSLELQEVCQESNQEVLEEKIHKQLEEVSIPEQADIPDKRECSQTVSKSTTFDASEQSPVVQ